MVVSGLEDLVGWIWAPVFWYGIVAPVALLVIVTLYLIWLDRKDAQHEAHQDLPRREMVGTFGLVELSALELLNQRKQIKQVDTSARQ